MENENLLGETHRGYCRFECDITDDDICRLTVNYSLEQTQKILEAAEKGQFPFVFGKVHYPNGKDLFVSLTPPEVTAVRNNSPDETNVIIGFFYCNIFGLWVSKTHADKFLALTSTDNDIALEKEWVVFASATADEIALREYEAGTQKITQRDIAKKVAKELEDVKYKQYWGTQGPRTADNIRKEALKGWSLQKVLQKQKIME